MEDKLFDLLGLGVPLYLAAATYAVFSWLDSNASDEATKVISSWLHGRSQNKPDLGNLIIKAFDRIYTSPLLSFRAFRRPAAISSIIWLLVVVVPWFVKSPEIISFVWNPEIISYLSQHGLISVIIAEFSLNLFIVLLTDYISLFFVRQFLNAARTRPISVSIVSSIIGLCVVAISFSLFIIFLNMTSASLSLQYATIDLSHLFIVFSRTMAPAFIIHLWLPLFALPSLAVKLLFWIFRAVEWAQWLLKQGDAHPFKATGIVATVDGPVRRG